MSPTNQLPYRLSLRRRAVLPFMRAYAPREGRAQFVINDLREYLDGTVLDVGCGANCILFNDILGDAYTGLDLPTSYKASDTTEYIANRVEANFETAPLPFPDKSVSTVICMDTLEHLDNPHATYDELFRVAQRHVIISLPNNWPGLIGDLLCGRNIAHTSGYGIRAEPKREGMRHKHFFNLEEAVDFLAGRTPAPYQVKEVHLLFEHGNDGLLYMPPFPAAFRKLARTNSTKIKSRYGPVGVTAFYAARAGILPLRAIDLLLGAAIWGWGRKERYYNLFCRQIWVIFEKRDEPGSGNVVS